MLDDIFKTANARPFNPFEEEIPVAMAVFGTGQRGRFCREKLERMGVHVPYFVDNDPRRQGSHVEGLPVVSPEWFVSSMTDLPVIIASFAHQDIFAQLARMGHLSVYRDGLEASAPLSLLRAHARDIEETMLSLADDESRRLFADILRLRFYATPLPRLSDYPIYAHPLVHAEHGDVVIDGGAATGDTMALFLEQSRRGARIHCFEPTPETYRTLAGNAERQAPAEIHHLNMALSNRTGKAHLQEAFGMTFGNRIGGDGGRTVETITLDDYAERAGLDRVDLIKLDVEGSEMAALQGAEKTVRKFGPKLQICLYHKYQDIWELPLHIKKLLPEYRLYLEHHSPTHLDTVLYCVA